MINTWDSMTQARPSGRAHQYSPVFTSNFGGKQAQSVLPCGLVYFWVVCEISVNCQQLGVHHPLEWFTLFTGGFGKATHELLVQTLRHVVFEVFCFLVDLLEDSKFEVCIAFIPPAGAL